MGAARTNSEGLADLSAEECTLNKCEGSGCKDFNLQIVSRSLWLLLRRCHLNRGNICY